MDSGEYRVYEAVNAAGLPTFVGVAKLDQTPHVASGESLRWFVASVTVNEWAARRIAANRVRQIVRWAGGRAPWLRNHVPMRLGEHAAGRPVVACWANGRRDWYASVRAAAATAGVSRMMLVKRLLHGRPDAAGRVWRDAVTVRA